MDILDISRIAVARVRLANGARGITLFGLLLLAISLINAGDSWLFLCYAGLAVFLVIASRQIKRGSRLAASLCCGVFAAIILPLLPRMSLLELPVFVGLGIPIIQSLRSAYNKDLHREFKDTKTRSGRFKRLGRPKKPVIVVVLISVSALAALLGATLLVSHISVLRDAFPALDILAQQGLIIHFLVNMAAFSFIALAAWAYSLAQRHLSASASEIRAHDMRPPILLLRSFADDMIGIVHEFRLALFQRLSHSFEEVLTEQLWKHGPVIAIGRPGEAVPPLGAAREYVDNQAWQARVEELSSSCSMLVLILGRTEGVLWEIRRIVASGLLDRTLIVFPPIKSDELRNRWNEALLELDPEITPATIPFDAALLLLPSRNDEFLCITGKRRRSHYYREALNVAVEEITKIHAVMPSA
jgi:hypothetical protein